LGILRGTVTCEQPNADLHNFDGHLSLEGHEKLIAVSNENVLYRGAVLKNTNWIVGIAVFTGRDTKLMKNLKDPPYKRS
jgi:phospholipid-transporting ATPase